MTPQPDCDESPELSKVKGKGARRVSNLSEEQRNKKRENDRIAQQNIRRRNKELIEKLQHEVDSLKKRQDASMMKRVMNENRRLEAEVRRLRKMLELHNRRSYHGPAVDMDGLAIGEEHMGGYDVPHAYESHYSGEGPYHWPPSSVGPAPATVTAHSTESSPNPSGSGGDFMPSYGHAGVSMAEGRVMPAHTSAPGLESDKAKYEEPDEGHSTGRYSSHDAQQPSTYLQEPPHWSPYPESTYYAPATGL